MSVSDRQVLPKPLLVASQPLLAGINCADGVVTIASGASPPSWRSATHPNSISSPQEESACYTNQGPKQRNLELKCDARLVEDRQSFFGNGTDNVAIRCERDRAGKERFN